MIRYHLQHKKLIINIMIFMTSLAAELHMICTGEYVQAMLTPSSVISESYERSSF